MINNKRFLKNLKKNWVILVPQGCLLALQLSILTIGFNALMEIVRNIPDNSTKVLSIIVVIFALFKLITMLGMESINDYGKTWVKVMTNKI